MRPARFASASVCFLLLCCLPGLARADQNNWIKLIDQELRAFHNPDRQWIFTDHVELDPANPRKLRPGKGKGLSLVNGSGRIRDLVTREQFQDVEVHVEFLVPKGSNSGVKLMGLYEIQIVDSARVKKPLGHHCGGIYPRAEIKPRYHHLDEGVPPRSNAARPAGQWQTLDIIFHAPRFKDGKKVSHARFIKVTLNGQIIHENVELRHPTGYAWRTRTERPTGPLLLQADHGPVAFRNIRIRPLR